ncbi:MAG: hypothetical protein JF616_14340 [Fibrobacteres bacterium]|nr:hypothetical protein [Fibrobacterota bacterium]
MHISLVLIVALAVVICLMLLTVETIREFKRMDRRPSDFTGSDRLAGSAE